jgi:LysM repeat protein
MASYEYPFDSGGRYVSAWAAEGERRAGRSASATSSDSSRWSSSHGGSASSRSRSTSSSKSKSSSKGGRSYTVKKGDTLSGIAARYGSSVKKIMAANGMRSDFLSIGRVLRIP